MARVFLAFEVPEPSKSTIFEIQAKLQRVVRSQYVMWLPESLWHITVQFIGEVDAMMLERIKDILHDVRPRSIDLQCWGVRALSVHSSPRIIVLQFADPSGTAFSLRDWLSTSIAAQGIAADTRPWVPHVTLGRIRAGRTILQEYLSEIHVPKTPVRVQTVTLFESVFTNKGVRYHPMSSVDLLP
ncbi:MAG: RNA 2',3'-cyclic phosphodiesterase [Patescibacteria group bacterium]